MWWRAIKRATKPEALASATKSRRNAAPRVRLGRADRPLHGGELAVENSVLALGTPRRWFSARVADAATGA